MKFGMYVYCKRGGISRDSGLHITIDAENLDEAKQSLRIREELKWLRKFYDEISWEIKEIPDN